MSLLLATSGDIASGVVEPEGVDFDGVNDYLSRSSDLVGNVDSKTFTFSCWVYVPTGKTVYAYQTTNFYIRVSSTEVEILGRNTSNTVVVRHVISSLSDNTYHSILISCNMDSSLMKYVYIDDVTSGGSWTIYTVGQTIDTTNIPYIQYLSGTRGKGRLSHVYLDYTYRDLSIEANRRLFITADGKPA